MKFLSRFLPVVIIIALGAVLFFAFTKGFEFRRSGAAADVVLTLNAGSAELVTTKTVIVFANTGDKKLTYANIALRFDPSIMSLTSDGITPSDKLKNVITKSTSTEAANGVINLTLAARPEDLGVLPSGSFEIARFQVEKKSTITTNNLSSVMSFDSVNTQVVDSTARNLLIESPSLTFKVNPTTSTNAPSTPSTPAATTTPRPTLTATPRPTLAPTAAPASSYEVILKNIPNPNTTEDLFFLNSVAMSGGTYQENESRFAYSGSWSTSSNSKYTWNTASVTFTTTTSPVTLTTSRGPNRSSRVEVWVNGSLKQVLNLTSTTVEDNYQVSLNLK